MHFAVRTPGIGVALSCFAVVLSDDRTYSFHY